ncbi:MAG: hypothetical protein GX634_03055, partial [Lentisphaerae bacterium]|nr:hypothetical protein [Lentisphaerota bacterium]
MPKKLHPRSAVAQRTAGITLDHAAPLYDWLAPLMTLGSEHRLHRRVVADLALDRPAENPGQAKELRILSARRAPAPHGLAQSVNQVPPPPRHPLRF